MLVNGSNEKTTINNIVRFEHANGLRLSDQYKHFLLDYNGGYIEPNIFKISDEQGESALNTLYGLDISEDYDELAGIYETMDGTIPSNFISIGDDADGNQICLGLDELYYGKIFIWIHDMGEDEEMSNMFLLANDFNSFLDNLYEDGTGI
ncbi:SMI1/KNR4 family protein [Listeria newyorkensis]|uniref:SMI1/KNR4 family protein n=1 Tax=Listeria newyorkensis TaxID=1497681 RepID=A0A841YZJ0_9LIST|nr:SMI1/KNR4 family protein [Listeria newyorkensis]MBC1458840.1 SMI1/KNR4 family protein [Listeria newyorkensis]